MNGLVQQTVDSRDYSDKFNDQSIYHDSHNVGGRWVKFGNMDVFVPSYSNLYPSQELRHYFETREPGVLLLDTRN